ncbi:MAG: Lhr helicase, partial [Thermoplasmataceae archaeon]
EKLIDAYYGTVLYKDSVRKLISDYMDLDTLRSFLEGIRNNWITVELNDDMTDSSNVFISHYTERVAPLKPTKTILEAVKNRLFNEEVTLFCTSCRNVRTTRIRDITSIKCPECGSSLVATLSPYEKDMLAKLDEDTEEAKKVRKRLVKNAHLVRERGLRAIMVMAARGIGPETASRLLEVTYSKEEDLIRAILNGEMEFARNRRFWD